MSDQARRNSLPILYTSGTHYEVGLAIGITFKSMIQSFLVNNQDLKTYLLPLYNTSKGQQVYQETFNAVEENFPQYVTELQGIADGADVPLHELFLLHMMEVLTENTVSKQEVKTLKGCTTICCNYDGQEFLAHTEDATPETMGHFYLVSAHIVSDSPQGKWKVTEEKFTAFCYAGCLPGYCMSYNHHGLVFSINTIFPEIVVPGKIPQCFLTRAMLSAENKDQAERILYDSGCGLADGVSINMMFLRQDGKNEFYNAEVVCTIEKEESVVDIHPILPGEHYAHCNKFLRLKDKLQKAAVSSNHRHATMANLSKPVNLNNIITILGDQSDVQYSIFREGGSPNYSKTIAVGIFNGLEKSWAIYVDNPKTSNPLVVLPIELKWTKKHTSEVSHAGNIPEKVLEEWSGGH